MTHTLSRLSAANLRELVREPFTAFFVMVFPFLFLGIFALMASMENDHAPGQVDAIAFGIPAVLVLAFASLSFFGTATTMITLRKQGTLRLLSTTPLRRMTFMMSHVPPRLAIALAQLIVIIAVAAATGVLQPHRLLPLVPSALLGLAMLFSLGFLIGGRLSSPEVANGLLAAVLPVLLIFGGVMVPLAVLPHAFHVVATINPLAYLGDALRHSLTGSQLLHPLWLDWLVLAGMTVVLTAGSVLTFRWDQGE